MISVVDYGAGNLRSVGNALRAVGAEHELIREAQAIERAEKILLPGVGHFGQMMRELDRLQLRKALLEKVRSGAPFLGVCLGMQALFEASEEAPEVEGLGVFAGRVLRFDTEIEVHHDRRQERGPGRVKHAPPGERAAKHRNLRVPHMGWNTLDRVRESRLLQSTGERPFAYFANSYYAPVCEAAAATCEYGVRFTAVIEHGNVFGVQFHPEKSGAAGLRMMENFACL